MDLLISLKLPDHKQRLQCVLANIRSLLVLVKRGSDGDGGDGPHATIAEGGVGVEDAYSRISEVLRSCSTDDGVMALLKLLSGKSTSKSTSKGVAATSSVRRREQVQRSRVSRGSNNDGVDDDETNEEEGFGELPLNQMVDGMEEEYDEQERYSAYSGVDTADEDQGDVVNA